MSHGQPPGSRRRFWIATNFSNQSPADNSFGVASGDDVFEAFVAAIFLAAAAGAAEDFPFALTDCFEVFFGEPMYLPWIKKECSKPSEKFGRVRLEVQWQRESARQTEVEIPAR